MNALLHPSLRRALTAAALSLCLSPLAALAMQIQIELPGGGVPRSHGRADGHGGLGQGTDPVERGHLTIFQTLTLESVELENGFLLSDYSVEDGDILTLTVDDPFDLGFDFTALIAIGQEFFFFQTKCLSSKASLPGIVRSGFTGVASPGSPGGLTSSPTPRLAGACRNPRPRPIAAPCSTCSANYGPTSRLPNRDAEASEEGSEAPISPRLTLDVIR